MRILGIDPGSVITGYGLIDVDGGTQTHVASGAIRLKFKEIAPRLVLLQREMAALIECYRPDVCAIESLFVHKNPNSALKLGQARGVALCTVASAAIPLFEYAPRLVKLTVSGQGGADKEQIQTVIRSLFALEGKIQPDQADALAIALTHARKMAAAPELP